MQDKLSRPGFKNTKRILVKIGSRVLNTGKDLNYRVIERICDDLSMLKDRGMDIGIVSSGAIAAGNALLGIRDSNISLSKKQALAAIGQGRLMSAYSDAFSRYGYKVAQILITLEDLENRKRYLNVRKTLGALLDFGVIPIINENDTVAVEEIQFTDNDTLASMILPIIEANMLIILTDTEGVYSSDPKRTKDAQRISVIERLKPSDIDKASPFAGKWGRGGLESKLKAAYHASLLGVPTVIASAYTDHVVSGIIDGKDLGTLVLPSKSKKMTPRVHWVGFVKRPRGKISVDDGATKAILNSGKSLLPCGVLNVEGDFKTGDAVEILDKHGKVIAVGLTNFPSHEVEQIKGANTNDIVKILGKECDEEIVHRDNMILRKEMV